MIGVITFETKSSPPFSTVEAMPKTEPNFQLATEAILIFVKGLVHCHQVLPNQIKFSAKDAWVIFDDI